MSSSELQSRRFLGFCLFVFLNTYCLLWGVKSLGANGLNFRIHSLKTARFNLKCNNATGFIFFYFFFPHNRLSNLFLPLPHPKYEHWKNLSFFFLDSIQDTFLDLCFPIALSAGYVLWQPAFTKVTIYEKL